MALDSLPAAAIVESQHICDRREVDILWASS